MQKSAKNTIVSLKDIFIKFDGEVILNHINLDIHVKEFVTILGQSGCGITTTLRIIRQTNQWHSSQQKKRQHCFSKILSVSSP